MQRREAVTAEAAAEINGDGKHRGEHLVDEAIKPIDTKYDREADRSTRRRKPKPKEDAQIPLIADVSVDGLICSFS